MHSQAVSGSAGLLQNGSWREGHGESTGGLKDLGSNLVGIRIPLSLKRQKWGHCNLSLSTNSRVSAIRKQTCCELPSFEGDTRLIVDRTENLELPRLPLSIIIQRVFNRCLDVLGLNSSADWSKWIVISVLASSVLLCTPQADARGIFGPKEAGNAPPVTDFAVSEKDKQASEDFSARVSVAVDLLEKGKDAQARGDFCQALDFFEEVTQTAGDLALAEYARVGHAVTLYEIGDRGQAIVEMEDVSIALKGYPEIHAALAAALYSDKHAPMPAEKQFNIATLLDPRYTDIKWVQNTKHWPPSLLKSLQKFISLQ